MSEQMQGKMFGILTIISPVNTLDLSQVSKVSENIHRFTDVFWMQGDINKNS